MPSYPQFQIGEKYFGCMAWRQETLGSYAAETFDGRTLWKGPA